MVFGQPSLKMEALQLTTGGSKEELRKKLKRKENLF